MLNGVRAPGVAMDEQEALRRRPRRGFIGPSNDGGLARRVAFRNLSIRELDGGEDGPRAGQERRPPME